MLDEKMKADDKIELMDLFFVLWRRKWLIICFVCFFMLITIVFLRIQQNKVLRSEIQIALNFEGVDKGLYPDGSVFERNDIISPLVLSKVGLDVDLTRHIFIEGIIPNRIQEKSEKNMSFVYHPNKFKIILIDKNGSLFNSSEERADVLMKIVKIFKAIFKERFIDEPLIVFSFPDDFIQTNEYDDIVQIFKHRLNLLKQVLEQKGKESTLFQSTDKGNSFSRLLSELDILNSIDLDGIASKIINFHFVKDKASFSAKIQNDIKNIDYERLKNEKMAETSFELLKTVMVGSDRRPDKQISSGTQFMLDSSSLKQLKADDYVAYLIKFNLEAKTSAIDKNIEIAKLKDRIEGLKNNGKLANIKTEEIINELKTIQDKISRLAQKANTINKKYLEFNYGKMIRLVNTPEHIVKYKYKTNLILSMAFAVSIFVAVFFAFLADYVIRYRKKFNIEISS